MARLFRCYNCPDTQGIPGRDFVIESGPPICPFCTLDGTPGVWFGTHEEVARWCATQAGLAPRA